MFHYNSPDVTDAVFNLIEKASYNGKNAEHGEPYTIIDHQMNHCGSNFDWIQTGTQRVVPILARCTAKEKHFP